MEINPNIEESWKAVLSDEFRQAYFENIKSRLIEEKKQFRIYPPGSRIFSAFNLTPFEKVKVVILGQDPYHGEGQANGLSFSVSEGVKKPPSLENIFREINSDLGIPAPAHGNLEKWAAQGVLLLNASLTVRAGQPMSHKDIGWEIFTDAVISRLSERRQGLVFLLWGKFAASKESLIDVSKHHVLKAPHPSPYSASYGFFGCKHFSRTNEILKLQGMEAVDWSL